VVNLKVEELESRLSRVDKHLAKVEGAHELVELELAGKLAQLASAKLSQKSHLEALPVSIQVGQAYRELALNEVQSLVSQALTAVFERPYECRLTQVVKRGQPEVSITVVDGDREMDPVTSMGGGILDVISLALRVVVWTLMPNKTDGVIILDEPARLVNSETSVKNLGSLLKLLSESLSVQFIVVTNRPALSLGASRVFEVSKEGNESRVRKRD
jgi:DNA repair exonuclease SbcCD ATPase subunit